ncbi:hypothetical protein FH968_02790 [Buttiauxella sp. B2]|uniref:hypothetical protein n=1 Tax=Buttiauxella sp. B2 TaxID=2587812 RepID=UPI00111D12E9|nr:hypothetical protein [Buttiauxella sp. B2]TNV22987.1 hypothetical protein FH968_02790 [Buttiauxella sp. B2]
MTLQWQHHGKIFDPTEHKFDGRPGLFAQSPQTLVFDDFIRIYFSTRSVDPKNGKYLSHVSYVDMDRSLREVVVTNQQAVISQAELGCFDEHGIFPFNVVRHKDKVLAFTTGWNRRVSVSVDTAIGLALSDDGGKTFRRHGMGPVMAASLHEPCLVADAFVKVIGDTFHMWYIFGTGWKQYESGTAPDRTYKIGYAQSNDGINWQREDARQIIPDVLGVDESQALPSVIHAHGRYHMFFCYRESWNFRQAAGRGYRLGYAWSVDGTIWTRDDSQVPAVGKAGEWNCDMQCYPHVFECDGRIYLLYNGNEFGRTGFGLAELTSL